MDNLRTFYAYDFNQNVNSIPLIPPITEAVPGHGPLLGHSINTGGIAGIGASNTISPLSYDIERLKMMMNLNKQMVPALNPIHPMVSGGAPTKGALTNVKQVVPVPIPMPDTPSAPGEPVFTVKETPKSHKKEFGSTNKMFLSLINKVEGMPKKDGNYTRRFLEKLMESNHMTLVELSQKLTTEGLNGIGGKEAVKSLIQQYDDLREKSRGGKEKFKEEKLMLPRSSSSSSSSSIGLTADELDARLDSEFGSLAPSVLQDGKFSLGTSLIPGPSSAIPEFDLPDLFQSVPPPPSHSKFLENKSPIKNRNMD